MGKMDKKLLSLDKRNDIGEMPEIGTICKLCNNKIYTIPHMNEMNTRYSTYCSEDCENCFVTYPYHI